VQLIGVHTPETDREKQRGLFQAELKRLEIQWPQYVDNDGRYWTALHNLWWPVTYLVDKCGRIRDRHVGELHADRDDGRKLEARIEELLDEPACAAS
jgi:hypothetical protein